jgi:transposase
MITLCARHREGWIMLLPLPDARELSDEVLAALRLRAVHGCALGFTEAEIAEMFGVSRETVSRWWRAFATEGLDALPQARTGRPLGSGRTLDDDQAHHLQELIDHHTPDELGIAASLWTRRAVQDLIRQQYAVEMPVRTVGAYLRRWGYHPKRPERQARYQDPKEVQQWLTQTYPVIAARATQEGAQIHWCDETGVGANEHLGRGYARPGQPAALRVSGERFRVNQVATITNQGQLRFMVYTRTLTASVFLRFLERLVKPARKKIFLLLDRHPAHEAQVVDRWVRQRAERVELFYLPRRAPELNPEEYLNNHLKSAVNAKRLPDTKQELVSNFEEFMNQLKRLPAHVRSYFQHPEVQYAAAAAV